MVSEYPQSVLELCCFEWFQNAMNEETQTVESFRAVLFRMVPKLKMSEAKETLSFRAVLFRMVPKPCRCLGCPWMSFRAVLFRMVPKRFLN